MEKNNGRKWTIAAFLLVCVALTGLTVAFATLTESLKVEPSATVTGNQWDVKFDIDSVELETEGGATATAVDDLVISVTKISGIAAVLTLPDDKVTYTFDVVNAGSINAKIGDIDIGTPNCTAQTGDPASKAADELLVCGTDGTNGNLKYSLEYTAGGVPAQYDTLPKAADFPDNVRNMTLTIEYTGEEVPSSDVTVDELDILITYVQE